MRKLEFLLEAERPAGRREILHPLARVQDDECMRGLRIKAANQRTPIDAEYSLHALERGVCESFRG